MSIQTQFTASTGISVIDCAKVSELNTDSIQTQFTSSTGISDIDCAKVSELNTDKEISNQHEESTGLSAGECVKVSQLNTDQVMDETDCMNLTKVSDDACEACVTPKRKLADDDLETTVDSIKRSSHAPLVSLTEASLSPVHSNVSVAGTVKWLSTHSGSRNGRAWTRKDLMLADERTNETLMVKMWNTESQIEKHMRIKITDLVVTEYNSKKDLSSTGKSSVEILSGHEFQSNDDAPIVSMPDLFRGELHRRVSVVGIVRWAMHRQGTNNSNQWMRDDVLLANEGSDDTIMLKLWNHHTEVEKGSHVKVTNLVVLEYKHDRHLSSTDKTIFEVTKRMERVDDRLIDLVDVLKSPPCCRVSVIGYVKSRSQQSGAKNGKTWTRCDVMLSDETSSDPVLVKLWNVSDPIEIGMLVVFTGLTVAEYMGRRYLSSTFDTTVQVRSQSNTVMLTDASVVSVCEAIISPLHRAVSVSGIIKSVVHRSGTRNGRAWSRHDVVLNDGTSADDVVIKLWNQRAAPEKDANVRITNLIVGEFNGHKDLSSTDRTAVQSIGLSARDEDADIVHNDTDGRLGEQPLNLFTGRESTNDDGQAQNVDRDNQKPVASCSHQ